MYIYFLYKGCVKVLTGRVGGWVSGAMLAGGVGGGGVRTCPAGGTCDAFL